MELSENIKLLRKKAGLTQAEVAIKMDMATTNYTLLENGKTELTYSKMQKLAEVFGVSVGELLGLEGAQSAGKADSSAEVEALKKELQELKEKVVLQSKLISSQEDAHEKMKKKFEYFFYNLTFVYANKNGYLGLSFIEEISLSYNLFKFEVIFNTINLFESAGIEKNYSVNFLNSYTNFCTKHLFKEVADLHTPFYHSRLETLKQTLTACKKHLEKLKEFEKLGVYEVDMFTYLMEQDVFTFGDRQYTFFAVIENCKLKIQILEDAIKELEIKEKRIAKK